jgi:phosphoesterase RecJ-like protein
MNLLEAVKEAKTIGISGHTRPDGDCIGAALGLCLYLRKKMPPETVIHIFMEPASEIFACLHGFSDIITDFKTEIKSYDVFFALDGAKDRMGKAEKLFDRSQKKINIDHHVSNAGSGDINVIFPDVASTCEIIYELLTPEDIDIDIAKALYLGIAHDTGVFRFSSTTSRTFEIAARLISFGFDFAKLVSDTYYEKTNTQNQILGRAIMESKIFMDGRCIVSGLDRKILDFYGIGPGDLEGIVNQLLITKGIECSIFMHQTKNLDFKISLRSKNIVDVAKVAATFGGGGHIRAAGVTMKGTIESITSDLAIQIEEQLNAHV